MTRDEAIARCMEYELEQDIYVQRIVELEAEVNRLRSEKMAQESGEGEIAAILGEAETQA